MDYIGLVDRLNYCTLNGERYISRDDVIFIIKEMTKDKAVGDLLWSKDDDQMLLNVMSIVQSYKNVAGDDASEGLDEAIHWIMDIQNRLTSLNLRNIKEWYNQD